uniref:Uncharacterized protein n=1 Tax=Chromera velia CCMP2878 TaxID=1169474 RepID=A0A0G4HDZ7_9ALVE|eukprot:Cvel_26483.t1-p1 / transcript=Cvel_26483.t1 / gene=Cvel_26483 / organism=Chromera_velia_CCMP2878 / gene_product=hypothetical protein / transcript_product=hypothetical protein / location=Cvel_scaffold3155:16714-18006(-) / protein_length=431 / sequence_SO=supercontig / SO=protein_coding / is_pseudo=false
MIWESTLPEDIAEKLIEAEWPKDDQRIRKRILGLERLDYLKDILALVPTLTGGEAVELLEWAHTQSEAANSSKSGVTVENKVSTQTSSSESGVDSLTQSLVETKGTPRQAKVEPLNAHAAPTVAFNTEHCLGGVLREIETISMCSGLPSPPGTPRGDTDALCDSLLSRSVALKEAPSGSQGKRGQGVHVDWSDNMDVVAEMERQGEYAHCVCVSMLRENYGTHADFKGLRNAMKGLLRMLINLAFGTSVDNSADDCFGVPLDKSSSAGWMCFKVCVRGSCGAGKRGNRGFIPDDIGVEGEREILSQVEGLRDLFGGDRVYVSSEDWAVLASELRKIKEFEQNVIANLPPMYVRIARGVIFDAGDRASFSEFDLSKFVPTSKAAAAAGGGSFADRVREYFRMKCRHAAGGPRAIWGGARSGRPGLAGRSGGG